MNHVDEMAKDFPGYPCATCTNRMTSECEMAFRCLRYTIWFRKTWTMLRKKLGRRKEK